jgi:hypothetical protein
MDIVNDNYRKKHIFHVSSYLLINLINYIKIPDLIKLLRCNRYLHKQKYIIYKYVTYPLALVLNWKGKRKQYIKNLQIDGHIEYICLSKSFGKDFIRIIKSFPNVSSITFGYHFNQRIEKGMLPDTLTHLTFGYHFNQRIDKDVLPNNLTHLTFGWNFNQRIDKDVLPNRLLNLTFGHDFNQYIYKDVLPDSLSNLTFGYCFNQQLKKDVFPNSLTHLTFGHSFNQRIEKDVLPDNLIHFTHGDNFDPSNLSLLTLSQSLLLIEKRSSPR